MLNSLDEVTKSAYGDDSEHSSLLSDDFALGFLLQFSMIARANYDEMAKKNNLSTLLDQVQLTTCKRREHETNNNEYKVDG